MDVVIKMPPAVENILNKLNESGYESYIVGGCVRDSILRLTPHDWDICTSATPNEVMSVFSNYRIIPTGLKHGTVTVVIDNKPYEITTYRIDGEYEDSRHPQNVTFTKNLTEDLSRRDFTINAMAYNPKVGVVDVFGGCEDLHKQILRCVGNPNDRFSEDALRIMRAIRFAATYGLCIDLPTVIAMNNCKEQLKNISCERINSEITKMLQSDRYSLAFTLTYTIQCFFEVIPELKNIYDENMVVRFSKSHESLSTRMALLFDFDTEIQKSVLSRLKYSNIEIKNTIEVREYGRKIIDEYNNQENMNYFAKQILHDIQFENAICAFDYALAYLEEEYEYSRIQDKELLSLGCELYSAYNDNECYTLSKLVVDGNDVAQYGFKGKEIGVILNYLLDMVMRGVLKNDRDILLKRLAELERK